jgi:DNA-binding transcriptional MerR regulator
VKGETTYTVDEAAAILKVSTQRVREMLITGELEGIPPGATLSGEWKVLLPSAAGENQALPVDEGPEDPSKDQDDPPPAQEGAEEEFVEPPRGTTEAEEPAATEKLLRGDSAAIAEQSPDPEGEVTTQQAAKALGISPRTVRWHIEQGNLVARPEGEGVNRTWLVSIPSLQALRDARQAAGDAPRGYRASSEGAGIAAESSGEAIRVLAERLEEAAARAAEYRVRLELTEQAESTLRAELEETRRRREEVERERDQLRRELEALREERRESPGGPTPTETPTGAGESPQEAREATQRASETLRGPAEPRPGTGGAQEGLQTPPQAARRRGRLWRRVFGG